MAASVNSLHVLEIGEYLLVPALAAFGVLDHRVQSAPAVTDHLRGRIGFAYEIGLQALVFPQVEQQTSGVFPVPPTAVFSPGPPPESHVERRMEVLRDC